jgi:23S rRNA pseudouridine1911/1915/1917 synthase
VEKEYAAITAGVPDHDRDRIDLPIGPHPYQREKMAIRPDHPESRPAETFYEVERRFDGFALVRCFPKTGRTHQIRLHLAAIGCPVACDRLYGGRARLTRGELLRQPGADDTPLMERQALHARRLRMTHPATGEPLEFESPLPADFLRLLAALDALRPARSPRG